MSEVMNVGGDECRTIILTILNPNQNEVPVSNVIFVSWLSDFIVTMSFQGHVQFQVSSWFSNWRGLKSNNFQEHNHGQDYLQVLSGEAGAAVTEHLEDVVEALEAVKGNLKVATSIIINNIVTIITTPTPTWLLWSPWPNHHHYHEEEHKESSYDRCSWWR